MFARTAIVKHLSDSLHIVESVGGYKKAVDVIGAYKQMHDIDFVVIDYLQLLATADYKEVSQASKEIKRAAVLNDVAILALAQLSRGYEMHGWPASNSDLRESGQIEQDADLIMFCCWVCKERGKGSHDPGDFRIRVTKRRQGSFPTHDIQLTVDGDRQSVE
jgi:replicative DNA helicase